MSEGNRESLYENGNLVSSTIRSPEREIIIVGKLRRSVDFKNGRRVSESLEDGSQIRYEYTDSGVLKRALFVRDGKVHEIRDYSYSPTSGLVSVYSTLLDRSYYDRDSYTFREDGESIHVDIYPGNLLVREVLKKDEERGEEPKTQAEVVESGNIVVRERMGESILETTYTPNGDVLSEIVYQDDKAVSRTDYSYSAEGLLTSSVYSDEKDRINRSYNSEGYITTEEFRSNGILTKTRSYQSDGRIVERSYRNGRPYSEILLDKDGLRVLDLVML